MNNIKKYIKLFLLTILILFLLTLFVKVLFYVVIIGVVIYLALNLYNKIAALFTSTSSKHNKKQDFIDVEVIS